MSNKKQATQPIEASAPSAISLDLGNAYANLIASGGITANWRSIQGRISGAATLDDYPFDSVISLGGTLWVFGEAAFTYAPRSLEDFPSTNRYTSVWYKRLFAYALHRAYGLRFGSEVYMPNIVLSIPARYFSSDEFSQQVKQNLIGNYEVGTVKETCTRISIEADRLTLIPEGAGAFLTTAAARGNSLSSGLWLVVDVGFLTTDIVAFLNGEYMPDMAVSDPDAGVSSVANMVRMHILGKTRVDLSTVEIDRQLNCDALSVNGYAVDISDVRHTAFAQLGERVGKAALTAAAGKNISGIVLAGGRADVIQRYFGVPSLPAPIIAPDPAYANAAGGYALLTGE